MEETHSHQNKEQHTHSEERRKHGVSSRPKTCLSGISVGGKISEGGEEAMREEKTEGFPIIHETASCLSPEF